MLTKLQGHQIAPYQFMASVHQRDAQRFGCFIDQKKRLHEDDGKIANGRLQNTAILVRLGTECIEARRHADGIAPSIIIYKVHRPSQP